jgi:hypothetical protein
MIAILGSLGCDRDLESLGKVEATVRAEKCPDPKRTEPSPSIPQPVRVSSECLEHSELGFTEIFVAIPTTWTHPIPKPTTGNSRLVFNATCQHSTNACRVTILSVDDLDKGRSLERFDLRSATARMRRKGNGTTVDLSNRDEQEIIDVNFTTRSVSYFRNGWNGTEHGPATCEPTR